MELNEIKKELYKMKPWAYLQEVSLQNVFVYKTVALGENVVFCVPRYEMGEKEFEEKVESQLLIRWIDLELTTKK